MRHLILLRHAKAERPESVESDDERRLTGRGRREAEAAGAALKSAALTPGLAMISPAARTRETADIVLAGLEIERRIVNDLYHAPAALIWQSLFEAKADSIIVIGHNPGLAELVAVLLSQAHDSSKIARDLMMGFPTAAWAAFELTGDALRAAGPTLVGSWRPEKD